MPGITRFKLNTIDRSSADCEHYPNNNYTYTGTGTDLEVGSTYQVTVNFTVDAAISPDMNIRVWIDYNQDGQLDDNGETVISADHQPPTSFSSSFTVPATATPGITRLRVTAKMTSTGGHIIPTPCDQPEDPLGYHGEIEDYDVNILIPTSVNSVFSQPVRFSYLDGNIIIHCDKNINGVIHLFNIEGKELLNQNVNLINGTNTISAFIFPAGVYMVGFNSGEQLFTGKLVIE
jgi:hypothetical protein